MATDLARMMRNDPQTNAEVLDGQIYIFSGSDFFQGQSEVSGVVIADSKGNTVGRSDINLMGASVLAHERKHRDGKTPNERGETSAYDTQIQLVNSMKKQFKNQTYVKDIQKGLEKSKSRYEPK